MGRVEGKVVFITGAARGQGRSHALRLAQEGADIIAVDLCEDIPTAAYPLATKADLEETVRQVEALDRRIVAVQADVRDQSALSAAVEGGIAELGRLDVVVANAGISPNGSPQRLRAWKDVLEVNLVGVVNTVHAALEHLTKGASIIATGSVAAFMSPLTTSGGQFGRDPGSAGYMVAKRALSMYMYELARELLPDEIRANVIHPTNVDTDLLHQEAIYRAFRPDLENPTREEAVLAFPVQQGFAVPWVEPLDISNAVVYLASDESRYITGTQLRVDAGAYLKLRDWSM